MGNRRLPLFCIIIAMVISTTPTRAKNDLSRLPLGGGPAVAFLKSLPRQWSHSSARDCKTYEDKNIDKLAVPFATSAAAFLEAYRQRYGEVTITSAYRTSKEQTCVCQGEKGPCAGRPHTVKTKGGRRTVVRGISRHQLGIALDVRPGMGSEEEYRCLHMFCIAQSAVRRLLSTGKPRLSPHGAAIARISSPPRRHAGIQRVARVFQVERFPCPSCTVICAAPGKHPTPCGPAVSARVASRKRLHSVRNALAPQHAAHLARS